MPIPAALCRCPAVRRSADPDPLARAWPRHFPAFLFAAPASAWDALHCKGIAMTIGTVKFFNTSKGFGFISPEGGAKDVFVHATALEAAGMHSLSEGQKVSFDIQPDAKGSKAVNLKAV